jgi:geranylgeranylglycerol-phosphate geranylgeranyltransferase
MSVIKGPPALSNSLALSIQNKTNQFLKLIRCKNIIPTLFLCGTGGWLMNPSVSSLLHSKSYIVSSIDTLLIMSASMIINDLFDLEIDKINNPERPLVTGAITKSEAIVTTLLLTGISEYLNIVFLPSSLQPIIHLSVLFIYLYTPVFKKIMVIKNRVEYFLNSNLLLII